MINWLVQSLKTNPVLAAASAPNVLQNGLPGGLLAPDEQDRYAALRFDRRRREWLLGRWTSKLLVQSMLRAETGKLTPLDQVLIDNDPSGAPYACWTGQAGPLPLTLSISHSGDTSFCAARFCASMGVFWTGEADGAPQTQAGLLTADPGLLGADPVLVGADPVLVGADPVLVGADIERVERRPDGFVEQYFSATEQALVERCPLPSRDLLITATWSAKEAALKALHLGLIVDTRSVTCILEPVLYPPEAWQPEAWQPFDLAWDVRRLNRPGSSRPPARSPHQPRLAEAQAAPPRMGGWWRVMDGFVLTLVSQAQPHPASREQIE